MSVQSFIGQNIYFQTFSVNTNKVQLKYYQNGFPNIRFYA